jgi:polyferredoxin
MRVKKRIVPFGKISMEKFFVILLFLNFLHYLKIIVVFVLEVYGCLLLIISKIYVKWTTSRCEEERQTFSWNFGERRFPLELWDSIAKELELSTNQLLG